MATIAEQVARKLTRHGFRPVEVDIAGRWISGGLISNQGRYIAHKLDRVRISGSPHRGEKLRFTCRVLLCVGPEFTAWAYGRYVFQARADGSFRGTLNGLTPAAAPASLALA